MKNQFSILLRYRNSIEFSRNKFSTVSFSLLSNYPSIEFCYMKNLNTYFLLFYICIFSFFRFSIWSLHRQTTMLNDNSFVWKVTFFSVKYWHLFGWFDSETLSTREKKHEMYVRMTVAHFCFPHFSVLFILFLIF